MRKFVFTVAAVGALSAAAFGQIGIAAAAPTGGGSAVDTVMSLTDQGYSVQFNGMPTGPVTGCTVKDVHGLSGTTTRPGHFDVAYVDIVCPSTNN